MLTGEYSIPENSGTRYLLRLSHFFLAPEERPFLRHCHLQLEMAFILKGSGVFRTLKAEYPMAPGDIFIFAANEIHYITHIGCEGLTYFTVHFDPRYLWGSPAYSLSPKRMGFCYRHGDRFENRIPYCCPLCAALTPILTAIESEMCARGPEYTVMVRSLLHLALVRLLRMSEWEGGEEDGGGASSPAAVSAVMEYVSLNYARPLTLEELAAASYLSANYLSALFRRVTGMSLWNYVIAVRIQHAMSLLTSDPDATVLSVAVACGFNNTANFNRAFRRCTGMAPGEFRRYSGQVLS